MVYFSWGDEMKNEPIHATAPDDFEGCGRKNNQRMKAFLVLQYLLKNSDEAHPAKIDDITNYLQDDCGIAAERRSVYKDIQEINVVHFMLADNCTFAEAEQALAEDDSLALIAYKKRKENGGYYVQEKNRSLSFENARLLAECVYSARFLSQKEKQQFIGLVSDSLSEHQASRLAHDVILLDAQSTMNPQTLNNIEKIKNALSGDGCKIKFQYWKYEIRDSIPKPTERRGGNSYVVSPYAMVIDNGNYYLRGIDERFQKKELRVFRIDRMRNVKLLQEPRTETEETKDLDMHDYTRHVFSMYGGKRERVTIRFVISALDAAVDRFGMENVVYSQIDKEHFTVTATIEVSTAFYGWLCGFGKKVKVIAPDWVADDFSAHVHKVAEMYQS